ncbi:MAG: ABC transporter ATP-binding protein [Alphaproteobacteria bacterium]|nr:ABC transporter ATP-binding protein [Alphaproteobacteria bacterium]
MTEALAVRGLRVGYVGAHGVTEAVRGVSLDVGEGRTVGLAGASGCGKSSLVQALGRTLPPPGVILGGEVRFGGMDLLRASESEVRAARWTCWAIVPQAAQACLNPLLTVRAHVRETLAAHGVPLDEARAVERLRWVELPPEVLDRHPHELSGGMRQRVALALALLLDPALLVLDEPTTALDPLVEHAILRQVRHLQERAGFGLLVVSHDLTLLTSLADEVLVMGAGRVVERTVRGTSPGGPSRALLEAVPRLTGPRDPALARRQAVGDEVLTVRGLTHAYGSGWPWGRRTPVLHGVDLSVREGETVALVGASGSGKSTVARLVSRLLPAPAGSVRLRGQDTSAFPTWRLRRRVQLVLQDPYASLNPSRTVAAHLLGPLAVHRALRGTEALAAAAELLTSVGLTPADEMLTRRPHALSGGQRQRVALARALVADPAVLVLDEPTSMLDAALRRDLLRLLARLRDERGLALLLVTHDLASARHLADRVVVLEAGRVVEEGEAEQVLTAPRHAVTQALVAAARRAG